MYHYTIVQWLFLFYFYCFFGWCFESAYVSIKSRKLTNRGFMRGPFLPLYGSGAIMMLVVSMPFQDNIFLVYVAGCIGATVLEYVTGVTMEALFKVRYWDYSQNKFNFQGHICLGTSLAWGGLTILMTEGIHVPVEALMLSIPGQILTAVTVVLTAYNIADFAISFKTAIDLRDLLDKMEHTKEELLRIQKRLDVIIAVTGESIGNYRDAFGDNVEGVITGIEEKLEGIKEAARTKPSEYLESVKEELLELKTRFAVNLELGKYFAGLKDFFQRDMIRSNPGMTSRRYKESLEELKEKFSRKRGKDKRE